MQIDLLWFGQLGVGGDVSRLLAVVSGSKE